MCYRFNDCCRDVGSNGLEDPCIPGNMTLVCLLLANFPSVCENGTVNKEGSDYFSRGPISICVNGLQRYARCYNYVLYIIFIRFICRSMPATRITRDVICQQIVDQITVVGRGMLYWHHISLTEFRR